MSPVTCSPDSMEWSFFLTRHPTLLPVLPLTHSTPGQHASCCFWPFHIWNACPQGAQRQLPQHLCLNLTSHPRFFCQATVAPVPLHTCDWVSFVCFSSTASLGFQDTVVYFSIMSSCLFIVYSHRLLCHGESKPLRGLLFH